MELGWSHAQVGQLDHAEYVRWRAYFKWRAVMRQHAEDVAAMRAGM